MSSTGSLSPDFVRQVRNLLAHLYDYAYLQNHPLAALIDPACDLDQVSRGQALRRILLDCIEALRPQEDEDAPSEAARAYSLLTFRFLDGVPLKEIAALRALGPRQTYRELERSVEAVAGILRDKLQQVGQQALPAQSLNDMPSADPLQAAQAEIARLQQTVRVERVNLGDVLHGVLDMMQPISERTGVCVAIATPDPWPPVLGDRVLLRQALLSLLTHVLDTVARGDLIISVSADGAQLQLTITESTVVKRSSPLSSLVDPQARVSLPVCEALLAAQSGRLETCRQKGRWQARLVLPTPGQATIVVVDDNRDFVALLQRYLAGHDLKVVGATDGEQALHLAAEIKPRLITLDVMMPSEDGWEILQKLKTSPATKHIPVIICSVLPAGELGRTMGASGYIAKPVRQEELLRTLQRWLGRLPPAE